MSNTETIDTTTNPAFAHYLAFVSHVLSLSMSNKIETQDAFKIIDMARAVSSEGWQRGYNSGFRSAREMYPERNI
jgi:hypothetical protein